MKRTLLACLLLFSLSSLFARPTLVVDAEGEGDSYTLVRSVVEEVATHSLLSRLDGEGVLSVTISELVAEGEHAVSADLLFTYEQRTLQLCLSAAAKDAKHLQKELEERLLSTLAYDGLALVEAGPSPVVDYTYATGYASLASLRKGAQYLGLDAQGNRWATTVVQQLSDGEYPVSLLAATGGRALLPGMRLQEQKGRQAALSLDSTFSENPVLGIDGSYSQDIGLYPFSLVLGGGLDMDAKPLSVTSIYGRAGFAVTLPLSMVFGLSSGFWRNSALVMECTLGMGYSFRDGSLIYGSNALFSYRYRLQDYSLGLGIGNKHWASVEGTFSSGLFMRLGLAYTW